MLRLLTVLVLLCAPMLACSRDWPVPLHGVADGEIGGLDDAPGQACVVVGRVFDRAEAMRAFLRADLADFLKQSAGVRLAAPAHLTAQEIDRAVTTVRWRRERGLLFLAAPCRPGWFLHRVVQPGRGRLRWEVRLNVDASAGAEPVVVWRVVAATRGTTPPLQFTEPVRTVTPGPESLTFVAVPRVGAVR